MRARGNARVGCQLLLVSGLVLAAQAAIADDVVAEPEVGIATIDDGHQRHSRTAVSFFYVSGINGVPVPSAVAHSRYTGHEWHLAGATREIPALPTRLRLNAHYINQGVFAPFKKKKTNVTGEVGFVPQAGAMYVVSGVMSESHTAVWIEDIDGNLVSQPVGLVESDIDTTTEEGKTLYDKVFGGARHQSKKERFLALSGGQTAETVEAKLGAPDRIMSSGRVAIIGKQAVTTYRYDGLGDIVFNRYPGQPLYLLKVGLALREEVDVDSLLKGIDDLDPASLTKLGRTLYRNRESDPAKLDIVADKMWRERFADRGEITNSLAWLCKALGQSGLARYRFVLESVIQEAGARKLRKYAKASLDRLADEPAAQFDPRGEAPPEAESTT